MGVMGMEERGNELGMSWLRRRGAKERCEGPVDANPSPRWQRIPSGRRPECREPHVRRTEWACAPKGN